MGSSGWISGLHLGLLVSLALGRRPVWVENTDSADRGCDSTGKWNWALACKGEATATTPFDYAAQLTEVMLLGIVALRTGQGQKIQYDGENMRITNIEEANQYLTREYRPGWSM